MTSRSDLINSIEIIDAALEDNNHDDLNFDLFCFYVETNNDYYLDIDWFSLCDKYSDATPITFSKTFDMSGIDFNGRQTTLSTLYFISNKVNDKGSLQEPNEVVPSEEPNQMPTEFTDFVQSIATSNHHLTPIEGNDVYHEVINLIEVKNSILDGYNNVVDVSAIRINNSILQEVFSKSDCL